MSYYRRRRRRIPAPFVPGPAGPLTVHAYSSLVELVAAAHGPSAMADNSRESRSASRDEWYGATWTDASKLAQNGDIDGAKRLTPSMLEAVNAFVHSQRRLDPEYNLDGGQWIDVARFVKGEPECWGSMVEADPTPRRGTAVIINVAASSRVPAGQIDRIGASLGGIILGLQATGHNVTLYAAEKIKSSYKTEYMLVYAPVNPGGIPLDVARMASIMRPWFLRRILFSLKETYDAATRETFDIGGGYGQASPLTKDDAARIAGNADSIALIDIEGAARNPDGVKDLILRQIKGDR